MENDATNSKNRMRHLSERFITDLKTGVLSGLMEAVRHDRELVICFRGGPKTEYINIYFNAHSLFKITKGKSNYSIYYSFNHARYTKAWAENADRLRCLGYNLGELKAPPSKNPLRMSLTKNPDQEFWKQSISILKNITQDFFTDNENMRFDFFKDKFHIAQATKKKSGLLEKVRQQELMAENADISGEYFVYDTEYDQARQSIAEEKSGRFDLLALRRIQGNRFAIVFIELKCTKSACGGKAGIEKHKNDLDRYKANKSLMLVRKADALKIHEQYANLYDLKIPTPDIVSEEILFVFTDGALACANNPAIPVNEKLLLRNNNRKLSFPGIDEKV